MFRKALDGSLMRVTRTPLDYLWYEPARTAEERAAIMRMVELRPIKPASEQDTNLLKAVLLS